MIRQREKQTIQPQASPITGRRFRLHRVQREGALVAHAVVVTVLTGFALVVGLATGSSAIAQPVSTTSPETLTDAQVRAELRRLHSVRTDCLAQAQQALALQRAANGGGRLTEAEAYGKTVTEKMVCVDHVNQDLQRLQTRAGPGKVGLFVAEDQFHQEYRQGLLAQVGILQRVIAELNDPGALTYETFAQQMDALRRQTETFKNRYIRLLKEAETQELAQTVFQANDVLLESAQNWRDQVRAERDIAALTPNGPTAQLSGATATRDAAQKQRVEQWETARQLVQQATTLAAARYQSH